jgi:thiazole synthase
VEQSHIPVIVDAGIGLPSHAAEAIELGADAVLANTAVAAAEDPVRMAEAFKLAVRSAELALKAGPPAPRSTASASSPMNAFDIFK